MATTWERERERERSRDRKNERERVMERMNGEDGIDVTESCEMNTQAGQESLRCEAYTAGTAADYSLIVTTWERERGGRE